MQKRILEAALLKYARWDDPAVADRLAYLAPALRKTCEWAAKVPTTDLPDAVRIEEALFNPKRPLLADGLVSIDSEQFEACVRDMAATLRDAANAEGALRDAMEAVDWTRFTTPDLLNTAERSPEDYFEQVVALAEEDDLLDFYILPVLGFSLRAFLDRFAVAASRAMTTHDDVTERDRPLLCPVCGGEAHFAAVHSTPRNGNVKHLYCEACGASWKFERIRCAHCGTSAVSDLSYVHEEADPSRRLHVCKACGAATPTFFASGDEESFSPEVERLLLTGLEAAREESLA